MKERFGLLLTGEDIADAIYFVVSQSPYIHVIEMLSTQSGRIIRDGVEISLGIQSRLWFDAKVQ